jgi:hypothetical protein
LHSGDIRDRQSGEDPDSGDSRVVGERAALEAMEPLRVVTYDLPGVPVPIRVCTRPPPEALAVASALGYTLPARLPLFAAA